MGHKKNSKQKKILNEKDSLNLLAKSLNSIYKNDEVSHDDPQKNNIIVNNFMYYFTQMQLTGMRN
jgi:hypothetical protein